MLKNFLNLLNTIKKLTHQFFYRLFGWYKKSFMYFILDKLKLYFILKVLKYRFENTSLLSLFVYAVSFSTMMPEYLSLHLSSLLSTILSVCLTAAVYQFTRWVFSEPMKVLALPLSTPSNCFSLLTVMFPDVCVVYFHR